METDEKPYTDNSNKKDSHVAPLLYIMNLLRFNSGSETLKEGKNHELQKISTICCTTAKAGAIIAKYFSPFSFGALLGVTSFFFSYKFFPPNRKRQEEKIRTLQTDDDDRDSQCDKQLLHENGDNASTSTLKINNTAHSITAKVEEEDKSRKSKDNNAANASSASSASSSSSSSASSSIFSLTTASDSDSESSEPPAESVELTAPDDDLPVCSSLSGVRIATSNQFTNSNNPTKASGLLNTSISIKVTTQENTPPLTNNERTTLQSLKNKNNNELAQHIIALEYQLKQQQIQQEKLLNDNEIIAKKYNDLITLSHDNEVNQENKNNDNDGFINNNQSLAVENIIENNSIFSMMTFDDDYDSCCKEIISTSLSDAEVTTAVCAALPVENLTETVVEEEVDVISNDVEANNDLSISSDERSESLIGTAITSSASDASSTLLSNHKKELIDNDSNSGNSISEDTPLLEMCCHNKDDDDDDTDDSSLVSFLSDCNCFL